MQRQIIYIGAIPQDIDLLLTNKNAMISDGWVAQSVLGTGTLFYGLACTPTSPATLTVNVAPGTVFSQQNIDNSAYGSLNSDTADQIVKVGISQSTLNFSCPAPATSGKSVVYLIQAAFVEQDTGATVLPYYNAANPASPWAGPNNTGVSQNTLRQDICSITLKTGVAATTGTQVTPAPDPGFTGLWAVTVANGATTITSGNIALVSGAPFITESLTQKISQTTADARYAQISQVQTDALDFALDTGTTNALVASLNPAITTLTQGMTVVITVANSNNGPATLALNGLTAKNITYQGNALVGGELLAGQNASFSYNGANFNLMSVSANQTHVYTGGTSTGSANAQVVASVTPSGFALIFGNIVTFTAGFTNTGATTINVSGTGVITIKKKSGGGGLVDLAASDLTASSAYQIIYDGVFWELYSLSFPPSSTFFQVANNLSEGTPATMRSNLGLGSAALLSSGAFLQTALNFSDVGNKPAALANLGVRMNLTANTTFYVNAGTGSDVNNGLTSGTPWATLQHAWNAISQLYDLSGFNVTIQLADGTYSPSGIALYASNSPVGTWNNNLIIVNGNSTTPSNVVINPSGACFGASQGANIQLQNMKLQSSGGGDLVFSSVGGRVNLGVGIIFGTTTGRHLVSQDGGFINGTANYTISGGAYAHALTYGCGVIYIVGFTITVTGTPAFTNAFADAENLSLIDLSSNTFSGAATGARYIVKSNSVINTNGGGATYLPGNGSGTSTTGGQYV